MKIDLGFTMTKFTFFIPVIVNNLERMMCVSLLCALNEMTNSVYIIQI